MIAKLCLVLSFLGLVACQATPTQITQAPHANINQLLTVSQFRTPLFYLEAPLYDPEVKEWIPQKFLSYFQIWCMNVVKRLTDYYRVTRYHL